MQERTIIPKILLQILTVSRLITMHWMQAFHLNQNIEDVDYHDI